MTLTPEQIKEWALSIAKEREAQENNQRRVMLDLLNEATGGKHIIITYSPGALPAPEYFMQYK